MPLCVQNQIVVVLYLPFASKKERMGNIEWEKWPGRNFTFILFFYLFF